MSSKSSNTMQEATVVRHHLWLLCLPFIWQLGMAPVINEIELSPFGLPFPMFWQMAGVVLSTMTFAIVFYLDKFAGLEEEEASFIAKLEATERSQIKVGIR